MTDPPHHRRNPRRAYDLDGREIAPPTVGYCRSQGETTISVTCEDCRRSVVISTDGAPDDLPVPDLALHLRCSACGSRQVSIAMDMAAHYARCFGGDSPLGALPEDYKVEAYPFLRR